MKYNSMKIYKVNQEYWFAAPDAASAVEEARGFMLSIGDEMPVWDEPKELTEAELDSHTYDEERDEDSGEKHTFRSKLAEMVEAGEKSPCIFASRDY